MSQLGWTTVTSASCRKKLSELYCQLSEEDSQLSSHKKTQPTSLVVFLDRRVSHNLDEVLHVDPEYEPHVSVQEVLDSLHRRSPGGFDEESQEVAGEEVEEKSSTDTPQQEANVESKATPKKSFSWDVLLYS